jgi:hypothetical protein
VIIILDKTDSKSKAVKRGKEGYYMIKGNNNYKYICTEHQRSKIYKANVHNFKAQIYCNAIVARDFYSIFSNGQSIQTGNQQVKKYSAIAS